MRFLMVIEPAASGHRMQYVRRIVKEAAPRDIRLQVATGKESLNHPAYRALTTELGGRFEAWLFPESALKKVMNAQSDLKRQFAFHRLCADLYRSLPSTDRPDVVFVPYLNYCDKAIALVGSPFGGISWSGLVMRDTFHHAAMDVLTTVRRSDRLKKILFLRLLKNRTLRTLFTNDERLPEYMERFYPTLASRLRFCPEPVQMRGDITREAARTRLCIPQDRIVLLIYGGLDSRKRIDTVLAAAQESAFPEEVSLLFAGPQQGMTPQLLAGPAAQRLRDAGRLFEKNSYLVDGDEFAVFQAADMVWLGYKEHYTMSAVLIQAGAMGLPVVACREGLIGWLTRRYHLGASINAADTVEINRALATLVHDPELRAQGGRNGRELAARHTAEEFSRRILEGLGFPDQETHPFLPTTGSSGRST